LYIALISFAHPFFNSPNVSVIVQSFYTEDIWNNSSEIWKGRNPLVLLGTGILIKYSMFILVFPKALPGGTITTVISSGALLGRFYGEAINYYFGFNSNPRVLAGCGAAAYAAVMTRSTAPAIIMLEVIGDLSISLPILVTVFFGYSVASMYSMGFFDTMTRVRKVPNLPMLFSSKWNNKTACEIMLPIPNYLTKGATLLDIIWLFSEDRVYDMESFFPVYESESNMKIIGSIKVKNARDYLFDEIERIKHRLTLGKHNTNKLYSDFFDELSKATNDVFTSSYIAHIFWDKRRF